MTYNIGMSDERTGEFELIRQIRATVEAAGQSVPLGIGDDMAIVALGGDDGIVDDQVLVTADMLLDGVHFDTSQHSFEQIGYKALACSLSDCAAMAVLPVGAVVSAALPGGTKVSQAKRLIDGMMPLVKDFGCPVVGGDTTSWNNPLAINVTVLARAGGITPVRRDGACVGDTVYVTGLLGGSILGRHMSFTPRVREARRITSIMNIHAMMDISDGISGDMFHICESSGVGVELDACLLERVISPDAHTLAGQSGRSPLDHALNDGEDFELLVVTADSIPVDDPVVTLLPVGRITERGCVLKCADGLTQPVVRKGFEHLR